ncbi:tetratricopeptide repeat protein [Thiomicrorhabdus xiamenensis]|uniref:Sel1 repeat family protein n=1 Tax=Thiomicrorhabdus xiamenensis TaxID=2739063 RepID=A0A7D4T204_9GAMM|nr:tetratricopeptide repeat protein [Thiomicrorhabdus xiamenensis]QKI89985.1 sel1 repeat family protein [Thiomicrorhabdus xiamenensis]
MVMYKKVTGVVFAGLILGTLSGCSALDCKCVEWDYKQQIRWVCNSEGNMCHSEYDDVMVCVRKECPEEESSKAKKVSPTPKSSSSQTSTQSAAPMQGKSDFDKGVEAYERKDYSEAVRLFKKSAEQGDASSSYNLGVMYRNAEGIPQDLQESAYWYQKAAELGHVKAQYRLGMLYKNGEGIAKDSAQSAVWLQKAAEKGHAEAQSALAQYYYYGWGVESSDKKYGYWTEKAANQGIASAQHDLGLCYEYGQCGVQQDITKARYWYQKSYDNPNGNESIKGASRERLNALPK